MTLLVALLPWLGLLLITPVALRRRPRVSNYAAVSAEDAPLVSIIVPARNEAVNLGPCLSSLLASTYPHREIILVDDRSEDGTGEIARRLAERAPHGFRLIEGEPLPPGWLGKPWACWQGYRSARGELLLFTDADTRHDPTLLGHAVGALRAEGAGLLTLLPRQLVGSFWERLVMPQMFHLIALRYPDAERVNRRTNPRDVIANGQFMLFAREAYEAIGGHERVRGDVVEDLRLAQRIAASGRRVFLAHADDRMSTRMYRSLAEIVEGWTKNVATGARQTVQPWIAPVVPWLLVAYLVTIWVVPPVAFLLSIFGGTAGVRIWSAAATAISLAHWTFVNGRMRVGPWYALLYPIGALIASAIVARSAWRGAYFEWKGRAYGPGTERRQTER